MSSIRILIVEDDPFIAMDIESAVTEQVGDKAELIIVESVEDARRAAMSAGLSCALLEAGTPFAFVSGSTPADVPKPLRTVRFLRKPFSTREIASFVSSAIAVEASRAASA